MMMGVESTVVVMEMVVGSPVVQLLDVQDEVQVQVHQPHPLDIIHFQLCP